MHLVVMFVASVFTVHSRLWKLHIFFCYIKLLNVSSWEQLAIFDPNMQHMGTYYTYTWIMQFF